MAKKISQSHSTWILEADAIKQWAKRLPIIKKISAGIIKPAGGARSPLAIKIKEETGCLLLTVRGHTAIQDVRLYAEENDIGALDRAVKAYADNNQMKIRR